MNKLEREIWIRIQLGMEKLSIKEYIRRYENLGYTFDRSLDCRSTSKYLDNRMTYPCLTLYPIQIDDGLSAWNIKARRDSNFLKFQQLRKEIFSVYGGRIVEV